MDQASFSSGKKPWYKTSGGIVFLSFAILLFLAFLSFGILVLRNIWVIRFGQDSAKQSLENSLNRKFTTLSNTSAQGITITEDTRPLQRDSSPVSGNLKSDTIVYLFIDFECPYCQDTYSDFQQVRSRFSPAVRFVFKHFPIDTIHPQANTAALAAECANEQNKFWEYYQLLFEKKDLSSESLLALAGELNLKTPQFKQCLDSAKYQTRIDQDLQDGVRFGVRGTPTYIVGNTRIEGGQSSNDWNKILIQALNSQTLPKN